MRTIKMKIVMGIVICSMLTSAMIGIFCIRNSTKVSEKDANELLQDTCEMEAQKVNAQLSRMEQSVDTLADLALDQLDYEEFKSGDDAYITEYTESLSSAFDIFANHTEGAISAYIRYNPDYTEPTSGYFLSRTSTEEEFQSVKPTDFSIYEKDDTEHVGWYYIPVENGAPLWMDPYLNANINVYMISYVVPLFVDGESVGIVGMDIDFSTITDLVQQMSVYDSGYAFIINDAGAIMYHKDYEVGDQLSMVHDGVFADIATQILQDENAGKVLGYSMDGVEKSMMFSNLENRMRLVLTASNSEINAESIQLRNAIIGFMALAVLVAVVIGIFVGGSIANPIKRITAVIGRTSKLDFRATGDMKKLATHKDEIGVMAKGVQDMRRSLREIVNKMDNAENSMLGNIHALDQIMKESNVISEENSETTREMAAGMQETASNTSMIAAGVEDVQAQSETIFKFSHEGKENSQEISMRAKELGDKTQSSSTKTIDIFRTMQVRTNEAVEQSKAVQRINDLTDNIKKISSQTNLLALNANIEAARAGDAGKGFAVVATEIGSLASETFNTVEDINGIVTEVNLAVTNMRECIETIMEFLEGTVLNDYKFFQTVGSQYQEDAGIVINVIDGIDDAMDSLNSKITEIATAIEQISTTVEQTTNGITQIAEKTSDSFEKTQTGYTQLSQSEQSIENLQEILSEITLS